MVVWSDLAIIEPPQLTLFDSVLDWVVAIAKAGSHTTVKGIKKPSQALRMSDKAYGTQYVP